MLGVLTYLHKWPYITVKHLFIKPRSDIEKDETSDLCQRPSFSHWEVLVEFPDICFCHKPYLQDNEGSGSTMSIPVFPFSFTMILPGNYM